MNHTYAVCRQVIAMLEPAGPAEITHVRNVIREAGIRPEQHVGDDPDSFDDRKRAEWWLGQVAHIIDCEAWWAMNSALNFGTVAFAGSAVPS